VIIIMQPTRRRRTRASVPTGPIGGLADPRFVYSSSVDTNIRRTFKRVRAEQKKGQRL